MIPALTASVSGLLWPSLHRSWIACCRVPFRAAHAAVAQQAVPPWQTRDSGVSRHDRLGDQVARCGDKGSALSTTGEPTRVRPVDAMHPKYKAVLVDVAGTMLEPSEPAAQVYLRFAQKYGCQLTEQQVLNRYRRAYNRPWGGSTLRYVGDARNFWAAIVGEATGCSDEALLEELYRYYAQPEAWKVVVGVEPALQQLRNAGLRLAVVSNFDTRLRPLLAGLGLDALFDACIVSAEVGVEKPNPVIFEAACSAVGVAPHEALHVGDDRRNDVCGARDAGCYALLWGCDVTRWDQVVRLVLYGEDPNDDEEEEVQQQGVAG